MHVTVFISMDVISMSRCI